MSDFKSKNISSWFSKNSIMIFCISVLLFSTYSIYSISKLNNNISNGINYTIKIDENLLDKNKNLTVKDIDSFEKSIQSSLEKSSLNLILENANKAISSVSVTVTVTSIFFTVLVVIVSLFQFMKAKDYEKKYEEYINKIDSLEDNFQKKLDEKTNEIEKKSIELDEKTNNLYKVILSNILLNEADSLFENNNSIKINSLNDITEIVEYEKAIEQYKIVEYEKAIEQYKIVLSFLNKENIEINSEIKINEIINNNLLKSYYNISYIYFNYLNDYDSALIYIQHCINLSNSSHKKSYYYAYCARIYKSKSDKDNAILSLEKAVEVEPSNYFAYMDLAAYYYELENFELALEFYLKASTKTEDPSTKKTLDFFIDDCSKKSKK